MSRTMGFLALLLLPACSNLDVEDVPTSVTLTVDRTSAAVGEQIEFEFEATGTFIERVVLDFGDQSAPDTVSTEAGPQRVSARRSHAYEQPGSYTATVIIEEFSDDSAMDTETLEISGG